MRKFSSSQRSIPPPVGQSVQAKTDYLGRTVDVGRMARPRDPGVADTEPVGIAEGRSEIHPFGDLPGLEVVQVVEPGRRGQHIRMRACLKLGFGPAEEGNSEVANGYGKGTY